MVSKLMNRLSLTEDIVSDNSGGNIGMSPSDTPESTFFAITESLVRQDWISNAGPRAIPIRFWSANTMKRHTANRVREATRSDYIFV